ncbi:hypothetical protein [Salinirubrum litoreum]|uniref:C2H2-type domain-containing protein n=1 Tax=Salinirubrum litoreum TaxID=1126234 RepID=A0ABD5R765_9EURY|nr:hypothetical protein [Salinirubrum litoreum]
MLDDTTPDRGSRPTAADDQTAVPPDETPETCDYCGRPFSDAESLTLHRGLAHYESLTEADQEAFVEAYRAEEPDLRRFRIVALGLLVLIYFGFLLLYAGVT